MNINKANQNKLIHDSLKKPKVSIKLIIKKMKNIFRLKELCIFNIVLSI